MLKQILKTELHWQDLIDIWNSYLTVQQYWTVFYIVRFDLYIISYNINIRLLE